MRLEIPRYLERFGAVKIYDVQRVIEIDGGASKEHGEVFVLRFTNAELEEVESNMAIIVPVKNENPKVLEGVISGIPHDVLVIVVSNSTREPIDRYQIELDTLLNHYRFSRRPMVIIHQKDPAWAEALKKVGYPDILDSSGKAVRDGKGEGMIQGLILAKALGRKYVGFVDSDNYIPGAVYEYVKIYGTAFLSSRTDYVMVRIRWPYKTKFSGRGFYFRRRGRVSEITNRYMNLLIGRLTHFETDIVKTANSGDHAMSIKLAEELAFAEGFAIEPYELMFIFEEFGGFIKEITNREIASKGVEIFQIEPRNPHIHEERGTEHINEMLLKSLSTIYHSKLCDKELRKQILNELRIRGILKENEEPPKVKSIRPFKNVNAKKILEILEGKAESLILAE